MKNIEKPECYTPNNYTYPLCVGLTETLDACRNCCLFEDMVEEHDQE